MPSGGDLPGRAGRERPRHVTCDSLPSHSGTAMSGDQEPPRKVSRSTPRSRGKKIVPAGMTMERALEIAIQAEENPTFEKIEPYPRLWSRRIQ